MNLTVKYTPVLVNRPEMVKDFLTRILGFSFWQKTSIADGQEGIIVGEKDNANAYLLLIKDSAGSEKSCPTPIIINTDDCIKDYHNLMEQGVEIVKKPQYTALGLAAEIADGEGNHYTLLEERNYLEN